jgi:hypothetical protein
LYIKNISKTCSESEELEKFEFKKYIMGCISDLLLKFLIYKIKLQKLRIIPLGGILREF